MLKRTFALLVGTAVLSPAAALAQETPPGEWTVGEQPIVYPILGPVGDVFSNDHLGTGVPPAYAYQPEPIPSTVTNQVVFGEGDGTPSDEAKFRFTMFSWGVRFDDPLRNHCDRGASHLHEFSGPLALGACSTYEQLREACVAAQAAGEVGTTNPGNDINCTPYWHPALLDDGPDGNGPLGDGVVRAKRSAVIPIYYEIQSPVDEVVDLPLGLGYVNGSNMDDPFNLEIKAAIATANAANFAAGGSANLYQWLGDGFVGWKCVGPTLYSDHLPDLEAMDCAAGDTVTMDMHGGRCWDGVNLTSVGGYRHVIPSIRAAAANGTFDYVCPIGWRIIPTIVNKPEFVLLTAIDSEVAGDEPYLSSDAMFQANARAQAGLPGAPVDAASFVCKRGCSAHFDYGPISWNLRELRRFQRQCLGTPHTDPSETDVDEDQDTFVEDCNSNALSTAGDTRSRLTATNQTAYAYPDATGDELSDYWPIPGAHTGPHTMEGQ